MNFFKLIHLFMYKTNQKNESILWDEKYKNSREYKSLEDYLMFSLTNPTVNEIKKYIKDGVVVLEIGSGTGELISYIKNSNKSIKAFGIDYSSISINNSKELSQKFGLDIDFSLGDIENLNFEDNTFDIIFGDQVIGHVSNIDKALSELRRVLKPNGICLLSTVNKLRFDGWDLYKKISNQHQGYTQRSFFPWQFKKMLKNSGFTLISGYGDMIILHRNIGILKSLLFKKKNKIDVNSTKRSDIILNSANTGIFKKLHDYINRIFPWWLKISIGIIVKKYEN